MVKRLKWMSICCTVLLLMSSIGIFATADKPSIWAEKEVNLAIEHFLVPKDMQNNYQKPIKRYEYVLFALEVLKMNGQHIQVAQKYPFSDVEGHPYESEIVKAFNAGIIAGYGNGAFKPDNLITREEIASLVYKLLLKVDPFRNKKAERTYRYSDQDVISSWAKEYIDYCYEGDLLKGIGKDRQGFDKINPRGQATIEQAILLLYRLADKERITGKFDIGTIELFGRDDTKIVSESNAQLAPFTANFGLDVGRVIKALSQQEKVDVIRLSDYATELLINGVGRIEIFDTGFSYEVVGETTDVKNEVFYNAFNDVMHAFKYGKELSTYFDKSIDEIKQGNNLLEKKALSNYTYFRTEIDHVVNQDQQSVFGNQQKINDLFIFKFSQGKFE